ncbi:hypothetical protein [Methanocalculus sp.]|nr:hypothetical protein [Methanocalculus sp.]MDG6249933.1 hypothetical protein [Methanocalculus sp.]
MIHGTTRLRDRHHPVTGLMREERQQPPMTEISFHRVTLTHS